MTQNVPADVRILGTLRTADDTGIVRVEERFDTNRDDVWSALTAPPRLVRWFGQVEGEPHLGGECRVHIALSGQHVAQVDACEQGERLQLTMRDPEPGPGQPEHTVLEVRLIAEGARTALVWEERGIPVPLLPAYGAGTQLHVEHLADYLNGRELRDVEARWSELLPAYESLHVAAATRDEGVRPSGEDRAH
jgi:uncharacterized protein YndB with AHSA1/START domain